MIKDYDCIIIYHLGKVNMVADVLSQKSFGDLACIMAHLRIQPVLNDKIKTAHSSDKNYRRGQERTKTRLFH